MLNKNDGVTTNVRYFDKSTISISIAYSKLCPENIILIYMANEKKKKKKVEDTLELSRSTPSDPIASLLRNQFLVRDESNPMRSTPSNPKK